MAVKSKATILSEIAANVDTNGANGVTAADVRTRLEDMTDSTFPSRTYAVFTALDGSPPATNFATFDTRNSIPVLDFDGTATNEEIVFSGIMPEAAVLTSGLKVRIHWTSVDQTTGQCRWGVQFERMNTDLDTDSFDPTANEAHSTTNATPGIITVTEITCTAIDSLAAGEPFRLKVYRDASDTTNDTMTNDAELVLVEVRGAA